MNMRSYSCCDKTSEKSVGIESLSVLLKLIGDTSRLRLLCILSNRGEHCVCDLAGHADDLSQSLISHHLADLKKAGLVESKKIGLRSYYMLTDHGAYVVTHVMELTNMENHNETDTNRSCRNGMCNVSAIIPDDRARCS
jgi:DNA-binding transcriptional ArsR family regulator